MGKIFYIPPSTAIEPGEPNAPEFADLTAEALAATTNNWAPVAADIGWLVTVTGNVELTGIIAPVVPTTLWLSIAEGGGTITIKNQNIGSAVANRFLSPNEGDFTMTPGSISIITYNFVISRWQIVAEVRS